MDRVPIKQRSPGQHKLIHNVEVTILVENVFNEEGFSTGSAFTDIACVPVISTESQKDYSHGQTSPEVQQKTHNIQLTSAEIAGLWSTYLEESASACVLKHFQTYIKDSEIKSIVEEALTLCKTRMEQIRTIFLGEGFPTPQAFSDTDVDLSAPALYTELFALSYVYRIGRITLVNFGILVGQVVRADILELISKCLDLENNLVTKTTRLMLAKGIFDRAPKFPYPRKVEFVAKQSYLAGWFGDLRPLNAMELSEMFFTIENNQVGLNQMLGLIQVTRDLEIKKYLIRGKELCEKQINMFNEVLKKEDLMEISAISLEVLDSVVSPFSDKLIMFLITAGSGVSISLLGTNLSRVMRKDIGSRYSRILIDVMQYVEDGANIMIERGWMEQPPQVPNRKDLTVH